MGNSYEGYQPLMDTIRNFLQRYKGYLLGQGVMSLAVFTAAAVGAAFGSPLIPALVVGIGGVVLTAFNRIGAQHRYENDMVDLYRDDIAREFGIAPEQVTRTHLHEAAKSNEVLAQAIARQQKKTIIDISTAVLAGVVTFGLIEFFNMGEVIKSVGHTLAGWVGPLAKVVGIGAVGSVTSLVLNDALGLAINVKTGNHKAAAHDQIMGLNAAVKRGRSVTAQQVYGALVAGDAQLDTRITEQFGMPYARMNTALQQRVLEHIGVDEAMAQVADDISHQRLAPGHLAYMIGEQIPVKHKVHEWHVPQHGKFVERLGLTPRDAQSHVDAVNAERANAAQTQLA